ncbi:MAG: hypothetical protein WCT77_05865 [Bacteroidota bacterium]
MTTIDFYKFIHDNGIEYQWYHNDEKWEMDVIIFPSISEVKELMKILDTSNFVENGIPCTMRKDYFAFWASDLFDGTDIELTEIFDKKDEI